MAFNPRFDPVFRLLTVVYGTVVTFSLKPFAEALSNHSTAAADFTGIALMVFLVIFFAVDWMWAAAYLGDYSPCDNHPFFQAFSDFHPLHRGFLLVIHFCFLISYAVFAHLTWQSEWDGGWTNVFESPVAWLTSALVFAGLWDLGMYYGEVDVKGRNWFDKSLNVVYIMWSFTAIVGLIVLVILHWIAGPAKTEPGSDYPRLTAWLADHGRYPVLAVLLMSTAMRIVTYLRIDQLVRLQKAQPAVTPETQPAAVPEPKT